MLRCIRSLALFAASASNEQQLYNATSGEQETLHDRHCGRSRRCIARLRLYRTPSMRPILHACTHEGLADVKQTPLQTDWTFARPIFLSARSLAVSNRPLEGWSRSTLLVLGFFEQRASRFRSDTIRSRGSDVRLPERTTKATRVC